MHTPDDRPGAGRTPPTPPETNSAPAPPGHEFTEDLYGWITHTDIASADPAATREWCARVLGWNFMPSVPMGDGEYHLFAYAQQGGGGIRPVARDEKPHSVPFVHVRDARAAFEEALAAGADEISPPAKVMEGVTVAIVRAPGGVPIGFSGP